LIRTASLSLTALLLAAAPALAREPVLGAYDLVPPDARPLTPEESAQLAAALQFDPAAATKPARSLKRPSLSQPASFAITRSARPDGASTYTFKRALPNLSAKVGADLDTGAAPVHYYEPDRPIAAAARNSGVAWASVEVARGASVDARVDPTADQGRLAATLRRSLPVGEHLSLTLQNTSAVTDTLGSSASSAAPAGLPMMTLPQTADAGTTQAWDDQPSLKFDVLSTGTSFSAGLARSSTDPVTHNRLGADQKLYGPLHVSTAITDVGETSENKSISAGLKFDW
jgi:hypothetical protein